MERTDGGDDQASGWMQVKKVCFFGLFWGLSDELCFDMVWMKIEFNRL